MSKKFICFLMSFSLLLTVGCATQNQQEINKPIYYSFADDLGNKIDLSEKPEKVVSLLGSYSEMWLLAGGNLIATTEDAVSELFKLWQAKLMLWGILRIRLSKV